MQSDEQLLSEALQTEREAHQATREQHRKDINELGMTAYRWKQKAIARWVFWATLGLVVGVSLVGGLGFLIWKGLNNKVTDQCRIENEGFHIDGYQVYRVVDWGPDHLLGGAKELSKAKEIAKLQGCK